MKDVFTSESVSAGHPDKIADQISDSILDAFLKEDKKSRVACEVFLARGLVCIAGEMSSQANVNVSEVARQVIKRIGYDSVKKGLDFNSCVILPFLNNQSPDIQNAVGEQGKEQGAGDQGIMFGYAVDETEELMPLSISLSHKLMEKLANLRKQGHRFLWPDAKSQVTVRYEKGQVKDISTIVISTQHDPDYDLKDLKEFIQEELITPTIPKHLLSQTKILVNPGGSFTVGGPLADCGLTGRKIVVDTYGGHGAHGGGAFSGKDPSKVDRSASYAARHIAKNIVSAGLAKKCLVQLSYAIGIAEPLSIRVEHFDTSPFSRDSLTDLVLKNWDLKPGNIIQNLKLLEIPYTPTAVYGHFGRSGPSFTWEQCDKADKLKKAAQALKSSSKKTH